MIFNIFVGFVIPWIFGIFLYLRVPSIFLVIYPFGCVVSYLINTIGITFGFWSIIPHSLNCFAFIPINLGIFPITGTYFTFFIHKKTYNHIFLITSFSMFSTALECVVIVLKRVVYGSGWNLFYTFISYLFAYILGYLFYNLVKRKGIL